GRVFIEMATIPIATTGNQATDEGQRTYKNALIKAATEYAAKTSACKRSEGLNLGAMTGWTARPERTRGTTWCTNPVNRLVMVPLMYVVAMPGRWRRLTAALCSPMARAEKTISNKTTVLWSRGSGSRNVAAKNARITHSTTTSRRTAARVLALSPP